MLGAFTASGGHHGDGHPGPKSWLRWQAQLTAGAASAVVGWMRRLAAHPQVAAALAAGTVSESWARAVCGWTDQLPEDVRDDADQILLGAAELADLAGLAEELRKRTAGPDTDSGVEDRYLRLSTTFRGAGKLDADLTPECAAALRAVLDALGKAAGPEDERSKPQRDHDALEEALRRLTASGCLPQRAGQPTQIQLHMTLRDLLTQPGAGDAQADYQGPAVPPGYDCDAQIVPIVTGNVDSAVTSQLAAALLRRDTGVLPARGVSPGGVSPADDRSTAVDRSTGHAGTGARERAARAASQMIIRAAADILSGPAGLASWLRTSLLTGPAASASLPLDTGTATETIPAYLRRLVIRRDGHCRFPGCQQPPVACQPHHIVPRSDGGPASLTNLLLLCSFHHLIAIHRWGWAIALHPDGTVTATSPDRAKTLHSHGPPARAA
jgi:hypothetical protein